MIQNNSYRSRPDNKCFICESEVVLSWYHRDGFSSEDIEKLWTAIGAKICHMEFFDTGIIPLNEPEAFVSEGDDVIIDNLANRILGVIKFNKYKWNGGFKTSFHPSVFKDKD